MGQHVEPYVAYVLDFIESQATATVVDLGCGDYRVGERIAQGTGRYIGCDIVPEVIEYNIEKFSSEKVSFQLIDIVADDLPGGDLCLIRQVFQHLSNRDIAQTLEKVSKFRHIIICDEVNVHSTKDNLDIVSFQGTRADFGGGLAYDRSPFAIDIDIVLETPVQGRSGSILRTVLYTPNCHPRSSSEPGV